MKIKNKDLIKSIQELEDFYDNAVKQIRDNPFIKQRVTIVDRLFGMHYSQADLMIEKMKLMKLEMYQRIILNYNLLSTPPTKEEEKE